MAGAGGGGGGGASPSCAAVAGWTVSAVLLQVVGLSMFLYGFFPVKPTLPGFSGAESYRMPSCGLAGGGEQPALPPDQLRSLYRELSEVPPVYDRLVLMVIDGLPAEFVLGRGGKPPSKEMVESMPYTQSLLTGCKAVGYHAKAAPPTVTMPRLKAMVSGAIGGFLDVAFNFNTQAFLDDNLLDQLHMIGYKLVMLGDETWIKLFPKLFWRQDGVSSFYVKDTVEVDFNVSRHLEAEFAAKDWNVLILHYLGLDHVGHIGGRQSILMPQKLKEMDDVIKRVHNAVSGLEDNLDRTLLVVVSDHGMTEGGNHGGSSCEETDSLALFIGHSVQSSYCSPYDQNEALQVDIAPTLSLLFGTPIPKNNIGVVLPELFNSLTDGQKLRTLELNSLQFLRLLQAQLPAFCFEDCINAKYGLGVGKFPESVEKKLCHLLSKAFDFHHPSHLHQTSNFKTIEAGYNMTAVDAYYEFLRYASEWLSHRATNKPFYLLISAISLMIVSCLSLMGIVSRLLKRKSLSQFEQHSEWNSDYHWHLDEVFIIMGIFLYVSSLGSSSFVEEEQYTWHYLTSTLYLIFLMKTTRSMLRESNSAVAQTKGKIFHGNDCSCFTSCKFIPSMQDGYKLWTIIIILVSGRILRAWHQGGVNWVHFPDISKSLAQADSSVVKALQIISVLAVVVLYSVSLLLLSPRKMNILLVWLSHFFCGILVVLHIWQSQINTKLPTDHSTTSIAQIFYVIASISLTFTFVASPWIFPIHFMEAEPASSGSNLKMAIHLHGINHSMFLIGITYAAFWCLLQLLLQQPINAIPILLIFLQIISSIIHFFLDKSLHKKWVQLLGLSGHFGLGNTNNLASIDVAGAFIGISSYSTVLSGILMFIITYGSPLLLYLGMVVYLSVISSDDISTPHQLKWSCILDKMITLPCLLPLVINSIALTSYTIVLLLMRNHLFVWSVFSPKYLYVCAATVCTYTGVFIIAMTAVYTCTVFSFRMRNYKDKSV
uniref:GPI ethanolamine phosphate transferase 2 C-terminal domain-containing protein n=1 Tax=Oryza punctata TaxID=4537 RepID=A0A0E0K5Z5_ORYPU